MTSATGDRRNAYCYDPRLNQYPDAALFGRVFQKLCFVPKNYKSVRSTDHVLNRLDNNSFWLGVVFRLATSDASLPCWKIQRIKCF